MEHQGNSMTDTGPLIKLKHTMTKIKEEIAQFEIRIGVVENTLLQARIRAKKHANPLLQSTTLSNLLY
jgi:estrogen-related receptor beta like 1